MGAAEAVSAVATPEATVVAVLPRLTGQGTRVSAGAAVESSTAPGAVGGTAEAAGSGLLHHRPVMC